MVVEPQVEAVHRLRLVQFIASRAEDIMPKANVDKMLGEPDFFRDIDLGTTPKLENEIARSLLGRDKKKRNPRRARR